MSRSTFNTSAIYLPRHEFKLSTPVEYDMEYIEGHNQLIINFTQLNEAAITQLEQIVKLDPSQAIFEWKSISGNNILTIQASIAPLLFQSVVAVLKKCSLISAEDSEKLLKSLQEKSIKVVELTDAPDTEVGLWDKLDALLPVRTLVSVDHKIVSAGGEPSQKVTQESSRGDKITFLFDDMKPKKVGQKMIGLSLGVANRPSYLNLLTCVEEINDRGIDVKDENSISIVGSELPKLSERVKVVGRFFLKKGFIDEAAYQELLQKMSMYSDADLRVSRFTHINTRFAAKVNVHPIVVEKVQSKIKFEYKEGALQAEILVESASSTLGQVLLELKDAEHIHFAGDKIKIQATPGHNLFAIAHRVANQLLKYRMVTNENHQEFVKRVNHFVKVLVLDQDECCLALQTEGIPFFTEEKDLRQLFKKPEVLKKQLLEFSQLAYIAIATSAKTFEYRNGATILEPPFYTGATAVTKEWQALLGEMSSIIFTIQAFTYHPESGKEKAMLVRKSIIQTTKEELAAFGQEIKTHQEEVGKIRADQKMDEHDRNEALRNANDKMKKKLNALGRLEKDEQCEMVLQRKIYHFKQIVEALVKMGVQLESLAQIIFVDDEQSNVKTAVEMRSILLGFLQNNLSEKNIECLLRLFLKGYPQKQGLIPDALVQAIKANPAPDNLDWLEEVRKLLSLELAAYDCQKQVQGSPHARNQASFGFAQHLGSSAESNLSDRIASLMNN